LCFECHLYDFVISNTSGCLALTTTFIMKTILFLQRFAACFGQYGHQQAQLLQKYTREGRNIERGPSPKFLLTRQRMPETEILNLWDPIQQKLYIQDVPGGMCQTSGECFLI